ncbi:MAG: FG-GAP repeat domain-containing protein [Polyangiales bacterium]
MSARFLPLVALIVSCADLPAIQAGSCGNGVIEAGEDCDGVAPAGASCRQHDEQNACHFDCRTASCPTGWLCGPSSGICSQPTGEFEKATSEFETTSGRILLGDVDGDGISEIVTFSTPDPAGRTTPRVFYFDDIAQGPAKLVPIRAPAIGPDLYDLTGDGVQDLVFSSLAGMNVMVGATDRTLTPIAFSKFTFPKGSAARLVRVRGTKATTTGEAPVAFAETGGVKIIGAVGQFDDSLTPIAVLEKSPTEVLGFPRAADFIEGTTSPCEEIYWVWKGSDTVSYAVTCSEDALWLKKPTILPLKLVTLPGDVVDEGVLAADVNGDGHVDLVIGGKANDWIAFGRGDGTFSGDPKLGPGPEVAPYSCATSIDGKPVLGACEFPIAIGPYQPSHTPRGPVLVLSSTIAFLDGVTTDAAGKVVFSVLPVVKKSAGTWSVAAVGDFNSNGLQDVVAGSADGLDLDFYNGTPTPFFNPSKLATDHGVSRIEVGDFDGDLVADVAFTEGDGTGRDTLSIAYGRFMAPPEAPFAIGAFEGVVEMVSARIDAGDLIDGIGLISGGNGEHVAVLTGGGERQLLSPFGFNESDGTQNIAAAPTGVAVGHFDDDKIADVAVIAVDQVQMLGMGMMGTPLAETRMWVAVGQGDGALAPPQMGKKLDTIQTVSKEADAQAIVSVIRAADLDHDGKDEAILFAPTAGKPTGTLLVAKGTPAKKGPELAPIFQTELPSAWLPSIGSDLRIADVDGDGKLDAVVLSIGRRDKGQLMVYFGDGKGAFEGAPSIVDVPDVMGIVRGVAIVPGSSTIVAVTEKSVLSITRDGRKLTAKKLEGFAGGNTIASGDVSGDGLPDLVIGDGRRVQIHTGVAK